MKTFMVLIPVNSSILHPRGICEDIEAMRFNDLSSVRFTESDVLSSIVNFLAIEGEHNIEVDTMSDFINRVNDGLNLESYFISYVYA